MVKPEHTMDLNVFKFPDLHKHGVAFSSFMELRHKVLIEGLEWSLPTDGRFEMDQYDHPLSWYSVVTDGRQAVAGARALPCNSSWNGWTYMLLDAERGKLPGISRGLLPVYPNGPDTWECTRLVVAPELTQQERERALKLVVHGLCIAANTSGATKLISLSPLLFGRLLRSFGYDVNPLGERYLCEEDGRKYSAFSMPVDCDVGSSLAINPSLLCEQAA